MGRPRSVRSDLAKLLEAAQRPLYVVSEQRRIVFCNQALADWLGVETDQLIGLRCDYHTELADDPLKRFAAELCPPPETFAGRALQGVIGCSTARGRFVERRAEFLPLGGDPAQCSGVVVFVSSADLVEEDSAGCDHGDSTAPELHRWVARLRSRQSDRYHLGRLIGESPAIKRVRNQVELAGQSRSPVQIVGPPGSGREHIARTIHYAGEQSSHAPLVPLSCSLLDAELLRTTVTAFLRQCAELETEQSAALLLLEVDRLSAEAQGELAGLLTLSELELQPLATARRPLLNLVDEGEFRGDLAHALSTLVIELPALSQRRDDVPLLAQALVEEVNAEGKQQRGGFAPEALDLLVAYSWPENVDELVSVVRDAHLRADSPLIGAADLPRKIHLATEMAANQRPKEGAIVLPDYLARIEAELIRRALRRSKGNKTKAAQLLGMNRARLLRRLAQFDLDIQADTGD